jgi:hypothetical protein
MVYASGGVRYPLAAGLSSREAADRALIAALPSLPSLCGSDGRPLRSPSLVVEVES